MLRRFPEKLRTLRKRHKLTQQQLADRLGMTTGVYISDLENGKRRPGTELVFKIADLFGVMADQLVRDELEV
ncbi:MAG: helix-turn-helix transcriptional regulator [Chloroflexaceae bacterium]|nr:helix-turn-helix transcriptional regulator [Chloroflexaceae bacterium]